MARIRVTNETEEEITIKPGDTVDLRGERYTLRVMSSRVDAINVDECKEK